MEEYQGNPDLYMNAEGVDVRSTKADAWTELATTKFDGPSSGPVARATLVWSYSF